MCPNLANHQSQLQGRCTRRSTGGRQLNSAFEWGHDDGSPSHQHAGLLYAKISWRVPNSDGYCRCALLVHACPSNVHQMSTTPHEYTFPTAGLLYAKINWRVPKPDGDFLQRSVVQTFRQQPEPDMLWNHGSAFLANPQHLVSQSLLVFRTIASPKHRLIRTAY